MEITISTANLFEGIEEKQIHCLDIDACVDKYVEKATSALKAKYPDAVISCARLREGDSVDEDHDSELEFIRDTTGKVYQEWDWLVYKAFETLQELTDHESGAIQYEDGSIWIGNWVGIYGIPREFVTGTIGLGEKLLCCPCDPPEDLIELMQEHEKGQGVDNPAEDGYKAWRVNKKEVIVIQGNWA